MPGGVDYCRMLREKLQKDLEALDFGLRLMSQATVSPMDEDCLEVCRVSRNFALLIKGLAEDKTNELHKLNVTPQLAQLLSVQERILTKEQKMSLLGDGGKLAGVA